MGPLLVEEKRCQRWAYPGCEGQQAIGCFRASEPTSRPWLNRRMPLYWRKWTCRRAPRSVSWSQLDRTDFARSRHNTTWDEDGRRQERNGTTFDLPKWEFYFNEAHHFRIEISELQMRKLLRRHALAHRYKIGQSFYRPYDCHGGGYGAFKT